jgi:hypothetical protein
LFFTVGVAVPIVFSSAIITILRFSEHHSLLRTASSLHRTRASPFLVGVCTLRLVRIFATHVLWGGLHTGVPLSFWVVRLFVVLLSAVFCGCVLQAGWFPYSSAVCLLLVSCSLPGCSLPCVFYCVLFTVIRVRIQKTNAGLVAGFGKKYAHLLASS